MIHASLHTLIEAATVTNPDAVAICAPGRPPLSYRRLRDQLHTVHHALRRLGIRRNDRVALVAPDGPEIAVASMAVAASATCCPLNPAYRASEYEFYLSESNVSVLVVQSGVDSPARMVAKQRGLPVIELTPNGEAEAGLFTLTGGNDGDAAEGGVAAHDDTALLLHTSGTTARSKRVRVTHHNLCAIVQNYAAAMSLTPRDRCLNMMPLYHGVGLQTVLATIAAGGSVVCPPGYDIDAFFAWLEQFRPSWFSGTPPMYYAILSRAQEHRAIIDRIPLRFIRVGADALSRKMRQELEQTFRAPVIETYGMTETSLICCSPLPPRTRKVGSVGVTVGPEVAIMDETGTLVPPGVTGEIVVRGPTVIAGYEDDPEANAAAFRHGWFRTGDLGLKDADGYLFLHGRRKDLINRGGSKIVPREVEDALAAHPAVADAVVFPLPHPAFGEDVAAAVVLHRHAQATEPELRRWVADELADFKVPCRVLIVDELPKGPTGKLSRLGLAERFGSLREMQFVPPRTPIERELARIWADVLGVERVGIHDNFFELGGTSLTSVRMFAQIRQWNLPRTTLLQAPTIKQLLEVLDRAEAKMPWPSLVAVQPNGSKPPFFCMHPLTGNVVYLRDLARHLGPDQPFFALQPQGLDGRSAFHTRIEEMAAHYVKEIRAFLPEGPYFLGGHSFGGVIAYEAAQQLIAQGQRVALLALIDTFFPDGRNATVDVAPRFPGVALLMDRARYHLGNLLELEPRDALTYAAGRLESFGEQLSRALQRALVPPHPRPRQQASHSDADPLGPYYPLFQMIEKNNLAAARAYVPRDYPGRITIFLGKAPQAIGSLPSRRIPTKLAAGGADIYMIPGGHATIMLEPHVRILAEKLRASIDKAIASAHGSASRLSTVGAIPAPSP